MRQWRTELHLQYRTDHGGFEAPQIEAAGEALICPEEVTLTAITDSAYFIQWSVGGQLIGTGPSCWSLLGTTTYTAQAWRQTAA